MGKYRKRPVVIEAIQWLGGIPMWNGWAPEWIKEAFKNGDLEECRDGSNQLIVNTLEGTMVANKNDFIIKGVNGELYPCKPDIFMKTYEEV